MGCDGMEEEWDVYQRRPPRRGVEARKGPNMMMLLLRWRVGLVVIGGREVVRLEVVCLMGRSAFF